MHYKAIQRMLDRLEARFDASDIERSNPEVPGLALEKVSVELLDRDSPRYKAICREYHRERKKMLRAMAKHPVFRSLALLSMGSPCFSAMVQGKAPRLPIGPGPATPDDPSQYDYYNLHHIIPKSTAAGDASRLPNALENLCLICTFRSRGHQRNFHHFLHGAILHPQMHLPPGSKVNLQVPVPMFPVYPPLQSPVISRRELRQRLADLGGDPLPRVWEDRLLAYSARLRTPEVSVPARYRHVTRLFHNIYGKKEDEACRRQLAAEVGSRYATDFLPGGSELLGKPLPRHHRPSCALPPAVCKKLPLNFVRSASAQPILRKETPALR